MGGRCVWATGVVEGGILAGDPATGGFRPRERVT